MLLQNYGPQQCCLCGESSKLTAEHKIKASALRQEFVPAEKLYVLNDRMDSSESKFAQSIRSKYLKFKAPICEACNTKKTQMADREFDNFHRIVSEHLRNGEEITTVFENCRYIVGSAEYLNIFRYFAKLLCCHLAEIQAPRPVRLSRFAIGKSSINCVWLAVKKDFTYNQMRGKIEDFQYAAHGGLIVYGHKKTGNAKAFYTTLTIGQIQYIFFIRLGWIEQLQLRVFYPKFSRWCRQQVNIFKNSPLSAEELKKLGL